jgi:APA family basic amino acid/polyamine antiporter
VHPRFRTPYRATLILGVVTALSAGLFPLARLARLVNVGMLGAFIVICGAVVVLRRTRPELKRSFRVPWVPVLPIVGMGFSAWLISGLPGETYTGFGAWMLVGVVFYFAYGLRHSRLAART